MRVPESWLRSWVKTDHAIEDIAHALTMAGLEVEDLEAAAPPFEGVVVARIISAEQHPNADRLRVCQVDAGPGSESLQIICGAPNARAGIYVACAREGAVLPGDFRIKRAKMRGVESQGMLCSMKELGIAEDSEGILEIAHGSPDVLGKNLRVFLGLDEKTLTLKLTPNRPDCLSVFGIARELSAVLNIPLQPPPVLGSETLGALSALLVSPARLAAEFSPICPVRSQATFPVHLRPGAVDPKNPLCGRFSSRVISNVDASVATPAFIKERLERAGQRSISVLVDISNYIMLELGRPSHIFDLDALKPLPTGGIEVRWAKTGESFELLNGQSPVLDPYFGVIADAQGPVALAGIMGGQRSAVSAQTRNILIEAAFWWPDAVRGRSQRLKFSSDAGHRFERGVSESTTIAHIEVISALILKICGGDAGPIQDQQVAAPSRSSIQMRLSRCEKVMGRAYTVEDIQGVFQRLQLPYQHQKTATDDLFIVSPPAERFDLEIEEDLIEEVARIVGFDHIPVRPPLAPLVPRIHPETHRSSHALRWAMARSDFNEVVTYSFIEQRWADLFIGRPDQLSLLNPIASQYAVMRPSLLPGLLRVLQDNLARQENRVRVFEMGRIFRADSSIQNGELTVAGVSQPLRLAALAYGPVVPDQWGLPSRLVDFFDLRADLEALVSPLQLALHPIAQAETFPFLHPGRAAEIVMQDESVGWIGEIHPSLQQLWDVPEAILCFELALESLTRVGLPEPKTLSRFPAVTRDLAFVVPSHVSAGQVVATIEKKKLESKQLVILRDFKCFDQYKGPGLQPNEKSLAFRFLMQDTEKTLEDSTIDALMQEIANAVCVECAARVRAG